MMDVLQLWLWEYISIPAPRNENEICLTTASKVEPQQMHCHVCGVTWSTHTLYSPLFSITHTHIDCFAINSNYKCLQWFFGHPLGRASCVMMMMMMRMRRRDDDVAGGNGMWDFGLGLINVTRSSRGVGITTTSGSGHCPGFCGGCVAY